MTSHATPIRDRGDTIWRTWRCATGRGIIAAMRTLVMALVLAACGGGGSSSSSSSTPAQPTLVDPAPGPATVADCVTAVKHVLDVMTPGGAVQALVDLQVKHCNADAWSDKARACMSTAMSNEQGQGCYDSELTNDQRKSVGEAMLAEFGDK
jgi:hypothetical protein